MFKCDCGKEHDMVPSARIVEKNELIKSLKVELADQAKALKDLEPAKSAMAELTALKEQLAERDAVSAAGFQGDAKAIKRARALYNVEIEGMKDGEAPTFADWLADDAGGKAEPGLTAYYKATPGAGEKGQDKGVGGGAGGADKGQDKGKTGRTPPKVDTGARPGPAPGPKRTADDIRTFIGSDAFQKLSSDQKRAKLAELSAEVEASNTAET